jgi:hypothetical protein
MQVDRKAGAAQASATRKAAPRPRPDAPDRHRARGPRGLALILPQREQALDAHGEAAGRRRLAAQLLDQAVVAAAGADRALRAELVGHPLEHGEVVVVQAAHQARVDAIGNAGVLEQGCTPRSA